MRRSRWIHGQGELPGGEGLAGSGGEGGEKDEPAALWARRPKVAIKANREEVAEGGNMVVELPELEELMR